MNYLTEKNNRVFISGEIVTDAEFSHEVYGEGFYEMNVLVKRLSGQGESVPGGAPGDLFLRVRYLPHGSFKVDGDNIQCDVLLSPWEAALGCKAPVPTLEGEVELNIPAGSSSGRKFRLRGKGLGRPGARGDLLARVMIRVPAQLSDEERQLWEALAAKSSFNPRG